MCGYNLGNLLSKKSLFSWMLCINDMSFRLCIASFFFNGPGVYLGDYQTGKLKHSQSTTRNSSLLICCSLTRNSNSLLPRLYPPNWWLTAAPSPGTQISFISNIQWHHFAEVLGEAQVHFPQHHFLMHFCSSMRTTNVKRQFSLSSHSTEGEILIGTSFNKIIMLCSCTLSLPQGSLGTWKSIK